MLAKPSDSYSSDDLAMLSRVLEEAVAASIDGGALTELQIRELTSQLGKVLMDRFVAGETNPEVLKQAALDSIGER
jgi:hypothetical protein